MGLRRQPFRLLLVALILISVSATQSTIQPAAAQIPAEEAAPLEGVYRNPLPIQIPGGGMVESCADPSLMQSQQVADTNWYLYCTTDPLNDEDRDANGNFIFHRIPMFNSYNLTNWTYVGDAFSATNFPIWAAPSAGLWAPEIHYANNQYYLYYVVTDVIDAISGEPGCGGDSAIGVATGPSPTGPWVDSGAPVIAPRRGGAGCNFFWTFDPEVITSQTGQKYIYYGSYYGGVFAQQLAPNGITATNPVQVTIANRYEGPEVAYRNGYYYIFLSAANCCNGPLTGYSLFVGRSTSPTGPFVDREGASLMAGRVGGTPFLNLNGNRWVGMGHNSVFTDLAGQWWTVYHAVDQNEPYFAGTVNFTKRPVLLDPIDWVGDWPTVRGGHWTSDTPQPGPVAQAGDDANYAPSFRQEPLIGAVLPAYSDEFTSTLGAQWSWVRQPATSAYTVTNNAFQMNTHPGDIYVNSNSAPVLLANTPPSGDYVVETRLALNLPPEGCCFNYVQAGLVIYGSDDNFLKLTHVSIWETRQIEFAKELSPVPTDYPRYGNTVGGPPGDLTWLRIRKHSEGSTEHYTSYTSRDGTTWVRGGTWTHTLGSGAKIGLVAMGGSGFEATFDYVRVYSVMSSKRWLPLIMR